MLGAGQQVLTWPRRSLGWVSHCWALSIFFWGGGAIFLAKTFPFGLISFCRNSFACCLICLKNSYLGFELHSHRERRGEGIVDLHEGWEGNCMVKWKGWGTSSPGTPGITDRKQAAYWVQGIFKVECLIKHYASADRQCSEFLICHHEYFFLYFITFLALNKLVESEISKQSQSGRLL